MRAGLPLFLVACVGEAPSDTASVEDSGADAACAATFTTDDEPVTDLSEALGAGTPDGLAALSLTEPGTLRISCGTWYAAIQSSADLRVVGADGATLDGAGIGVPLTATGSTLQVESLALENGLGVHGGCLSFSGLRLTLEGTSFTGCVAEVGGAVYSEATEVSVARSAFTGDAASVEGASPAPSLLGGALYLAESDASFEMVELSGNVAGNSYAYQDVLGGGIYHEGGTLRISGSTLSSNRAQNGYLSDTLGGAIYAGGSVEISDSALTDNQVRGGASFGAGGAVFARGDLSLDHVTLSGCSSSDKYSLASGGAAWARTVRVVDSEVTDNQSESVLYGVLVAQEGGSCSTTLFSGNLPADAAGPSGDLVDLSSCATTTGGTW